MKLDSNALAFSVGGAAAIGVLGLVVVLSRVEVQPVVTSPPEAPPSTSTTASVPSPEQVRNAIRAAQSTCGGAQVELTRIPPFDELLEWVDGLFGHTVTSANLGDSWAIEQLPIAACLRSEINTFVQLHGG